MSGDVRRDLEGIASRSISANAFCSGLPKGQPRLELSFASNVVVRFLVPAEPSRPGTDRLLQVCHVLSPEQTFLDLSEIIRNLKSW